MCEVTPYMASVATKRGISIIYHSLPWYNYQGHSMPNQQKKSRPLQIFMKFGIDMDATKTLSHTKIWPILLISL